MSPPVRPPVPSPTTISSSTTDPTPGDDVAIASIEVLGQSTPTTTPTTPTTTATGDLPLTGSDTRVLAAIGMAMLLSGLLVLARRRSEND